MTFKIDKNLLYKLCFFVIFFTCFNITIYGYFISRNVVLLMNIVATVILLLLNFNLVVKRYNILYTFGLLAVLGLFIFRNYQLSSNPTSCFWLLWILIIAFVLQFSNKWIPNAFSVIKIFTVEHLIGTYFCYFFPDLYKSNILPIFSGNTGYSDLLNQVNANMLAGFTSNYGINAIYLTIGLICLFCSTLQKDKVRIWDVVKIIIVFLAIILTGKRGAFVFGTLSLVVIYIICNRSNISKRIISEIVLIGFGVIVVTVASQFIPGLNLVFERLTNSGDLLHGREFLYKYALDLFKQNPVFGIGWGNFKYLVESNYPSYGLVNVHNMYLQLLCEVGIIGTLFVVVLMFLTCKFTINLFKNDYYTKYKSELMISIGLQFFTFLIGISSTPIYGVECLYPYIIACAISYALYINNNFERK